MVATYFKFPPEKYKKLLDQEIQKCYRKENKQNVQKINLEHKATAVELELSDRMFHATPREAYITLKDHKPDFETRPNVRSINPSKPDIGQIAKQILDNIVKDIRAKSDLKQCTNTEDVIQWFESIKERPKLSFIVFDIESFYPSITPTLLNRALEWAENYVTVTPQQTKIIHQASQSFLFSKGSPWVKKGDINFDIGMGAYHGAQACEIVGLFLLNQISELPNFN